MHVFLLAAISADGFIGGGPEHRSFEWTSEEDKKFYVDSIKRARVVVMGMRTFKTFSRYPRGLKYVLYTNSPEEFVNPKPEVIQTLATKDDPKKILAQLESEGYDEVAICGGATIYTMFLKAGVVDTLYLSVEPVLFGSGVKLLSEEFSAKLQLKDTKKIGDQTVLLEYAVVK
jgi:dihydrofolate reductase